MLENSDIQKISIGKLIKIAEIFDLSIEELIECGEVSMNIKERIHELAKKKGISIPKLEEELNLGNGTISRWSKSSPSVNKLSPIAQYFNVSLDYLVGDSEDSKPTFGRVLKELREQKRLKQRELAKQIGVVRTLITNYELGLTKPSMENLIKLANYFNVSLDYLVGDVEDSKPTSDEFGKALTKLRKSKGLTQKELSRELNIPLGTIGSYEGGFRNPSVEQLKVLANYFNVSTDYLLGLKKECTTMNNLVEKDMFTSLELVEQINHFRELEGNRSSLRHNDLLKVIRDEFEEEIGMGRISQTPYKHPQNEQMYPMFILTTSQAKQVLVRESKFVRRAVIKYIERLESAFKQATQPQITTTMKDLVRYLIELRSVMRDADQPKEKIADAFEMVSNQFGVKLPEFFVKDNITEDMNINKICDFSKNTPKAKFEDYVVSLSLPIKGSIEVKGRRVK